MVSPSWRAGNGQTEGDYPYSVAEHSLLVGGSSCPDFSRNRAEMAACGPFSNDAPEYVIGDMISPVKDAVGPDYGALDDRLAAAIHIRFGLPVNVAGRGQEGRSRQADRISAWLRGPPPRRSPDFPWTRRTGSSEFPTPARSRE